MLHPPGLWLLLLCTQFAIVQLVLNVQYGDGARNLHWAMLVVEQPGYLVGAYDPYDMVAGFIPDPPSLAPLGLPQPHAGSFNRWWGPVPVLLAAGVWWLTGSLALMALVTPIAAGLTVLLVYTIGRRLFDRRAALMAAALTGLFPLFYEFAVISYSEAISALFLTLALWMYLRERTLPAVLFGSIALLCKINVAPIYCGAVVVSLFYRFYMIRWGSRNSRAPAAFALRHSLAALLLPLIPLTIWFWATHGSLTPSLGQRLSLDLFLSLLPQMLEMLFYIPWYGALLTLSVLAICVWVGLRSPRLAAEQRLVFGAWIVLGLGTLAVYTATPSASNSPRVVLPVMPALALLAGEGWSHLPRRWSNRTAVYLIGLFCVINLFISYYASETVRYDRTFTDVWSVLRQQPRGFVMTSHYWPTLVQTRQPVTWFESDRQFQRNILQNRDHFVAYVTRHPIRYIVVPRAGTAAAISYPYIQVETTDLFSPEVLDYLDQNAQRIPVPPLYDIFVLYQTAF